MLCSRGADLLLTSRPRHVPAELIEQRAQHAVDAWRRVAAANKGGDSHVPILAALMRRQVRAPAHAHGMRPKG
jgi:hypothetical protein